MMENKVAVSIVIPAKNEEHHIGECLDAVYRQATDFPYEVIVIDSGSTDHTVDIVRQFKAVRLLEIPAASFGHGKTRNLGATIASGADVVFLNADAIPANSRWLSSLMNGLHHEKRAGIFSRHLPKKECYLYMSRDLAQSMPETPSVRNQTNTLDFMIFSTVSGAVRRSIWQEFPFADDIIIAEDQQWAKKVLEQGYTIAYEPASQVYHSHNYSPRQLFLIKQQVGFATSPFKNRFSALVYGFILVMGGILFKLAGDAAFIFFKNREALPFRRRLKEFKIAIYARVAGFWGRYIGWLHAKQHHKK